MGRNTKALRPALLLCVYPFGGSAVTFTDPQSLDEERRCLTAIKHGDRAAFLRLYQLALLATIVLGAGCASSEPPEMAQPTPGAPRSAATPADLQEVEVIREVVDGQGRTLEAEQSQAEPDCYARPPARAQHLHAGRAHLQDRGALPRRRSDRRQLQRCEAALRPRRRDRAAAVHVAEGVVTRERQLSQGLPSP